MSFNYVNNHLVSLSGWQQDRVEHNRTVFSDTTRLVPLSVLQCNLSQSISTTNPIICSIKSSFTNNYICLTYFFLWESRIQSSLSLFHGDWMLSVHLTQIKKVRLHSPEPAILLYLATCIQRSAKTTQAYRHLLCSYELQNIFCIIVQSQTLLCSMHLIWTACKAFGVDVAQLLAYC